MRLLLDEHFSPEIARQLRRRDVDVVAARERQDLHGLSDRALLGVAISERRVIVTENVPDFVALHREFVTRGEPHGGIVFTSPRGFPRTRRGIGRTVRALEALITEAPDMTSQTRWL